MLRFFIFVLIGFATSLAMAQIPTPLPFNLAASSPATAPAATPAAPAVGVAAPGPGLLNGYVPDATYKLRVGDTVSFQILEDRIWNSLDVPKPLVVTDSGEVDVPYIGRVMAADDVTSLAPRVDGVIFVVRAEYTSSRVAHAALNMLYQRKANVLGLVFNSVHVSTGDYYYYYRYQDYHKA